MWVALGVVVVLLAVVAWDGLNPPVRLSWPHADGAGRVMRPSGQVVRHSLHRTLYGARMAARQARIDYSPGGRLYAPAV